MVPTERPEVSIGALRRAVAVTLPDYMVPSAFVILDELRDVSFRPASAPMARTAQQPGGASH